MRGFGRVRAGESRTRSGTACGDRARSEKGRDRRPRRRGVARRLGAGQNSQHRAARADVAGEAAGRTRTATRGAPVTRGSRRYPVPLTVRAKEQLPSARRRVLGASHTSRRVLQRCGLMEDRLYVEIARDAAVSVVDEVLALGA